MPSRRALVWLAVALAIPAALGAAGGWLAGVVGAGASLVGWVYLSLVLPRRAHAAFDAGRYARASRRYRVLEVIAPNARRARAALLSRAGCAAALGAHDRADALLSRVADPAGTGLDAGERAAWLNNRAYALLGRAGDATAALALVDEATGLRPDVPALQHTRGMALLAVGRVDEAIAVFDGMRAGGDLSPRLEAERCSELAKAWAAKGEAAYAEDYRMRADGLSR